LAPSFTSPTGWEVGGAEVPVRLEVSQQEIHIKEESSYAFLTIYMSSKRFLSKKFSKDIPQQENDSDLRRIFIIKR